MSFDLHHKRIDWARKTHRRIVAASLVQGAYNLDKERHNESNYKHEIDEKAETIGERLGFEIFECHRDIDDGPYFAIVYKYKHALHENRDPKISPPKYVIAFRGTYTKRDFVLDLEFILHELHKSWRFEPTKKVVENIISISGGPENVWLAGHSLGSATALMVGRSMVMNMEFHLDTYLFNPPFVAFSSFKPFKHIYWSGRSILTAAVEKIVHHSKTKEERERVFNKLNAWKPKLFVNNRDYISNGYISYFKQRIRMHRRFEDGATQNSLISLVGEVFHKDFEPIHLIPSADLTTTKGSCCHPRRAHGIKQWQNADLSIDNESYFFKNIPVALSFVPVEDDQLGHLT